MAGRPGLPVLSTGSAAVGPGRPAAEVPNQYQLLRIDAAGLTRHLRMYVPGQKRWVGDTRISASGSDSSTRLDRPWANATAVFPPPPRDPGDPDDKIGNRAAEVDRLRVGESDWSGRHDRVRRTPS